MDIHERLDITRQQDCLQGQIDGFTQSALTHLGEECDADEDPDDFNIDILDDLKDDPADFTETSDVWTNTPKLAIIPLPSNLGVDQCRLCMADDLILLEMSLRERQANDALHNLRIHLYNKAILFRTTVRQAKSQALKTRAWSQVLQSLYAPLFFSFTLFLGLPHHSLTYHFRPWSLDRTFIRDSFRLGSVYDLF
ncbi:hypothetical protein BDR04DRAFT_1165017 [Suillus decipiens]|nr:hypothetical protein BDR04DRAFT_1165017 [Suillus decipiens]